MTAAIARASPPPCTTPPSEKCERLPFPSRNAPRMIATSAVTFTRVVTPLTAAPTCAPSTLANVRVTMAAIAIDCTVAACAGAPSRLSRNSAKTVASEATAVGVVTNTYNQPKTNAAASPYASRKNTYTPPARGSSVLSSATASAPQHDSGVGPLIGDEQPPPGRVQAEIARPIALCGDHLLERERAGGLRHGEHRDAVVAAVRHVQRPAARCDVNVGRVIRAGPPSRDGRTYALRRKCAVLGVESQRGYRGIELIGDEHQRRRRVEGEVARAGAGAHDRIAFLYMAQRPAIDVEPIDEHAVGAEVCGEREAVRGIGKDAVGMRRFLTLGIRSFTRVLHHGRGRSECTIRLDRQQRDAAPGVVGDE